MAIVKKVTELLTKNYGHCAAVIVAAGSSNRMNGTDKIFAALGGEPLICHTIRAFQSCNTVSEIVVVSREQSYSQLSRLCHEKGFDKVTMIVSGGDSRAESVMNGLGHISKKTKLVAIHDGARPFVSQETIERTFQKAASFHAAAPAVAVKDTIKSAQNRIVTGTPDRASLFAVQTPQIFDFDLIRGALKKVLDEDLPVTDDCSAVESLGMSVYLTQGSDDNIKITTPTDLVFAEAIINNRRTL